MIAKPRYGTIEDNLQEVPLKTVFAFMLVVASSSAFATPSANGGSILRACREVNAYGLNEPSPQQVRACMDIAKAYGVSADDIRDSGCRDASANWSGGSWTPNPTGAVRCLLTIFGP
jgi:hypothetical protein